jgi:hypothetical protein
MRDLRERIAAQIAMNDWEIVADNLSKAGWSLGCVSVLDSMGRTIWIADAHRDDGKRFVVHAVEKLTAFMEAESAILLFQLFNRPFRLTKTS